MILTKIEEKIFWVTKFSLFLPCAHTYEAIHFYLPNADNEWF